MLSSRYLVISRILFFLESKSPFFWQIVFLNHGTCIIPRVNKWSLSCMNSSRWLTLNPPALSPNIVTCWGSPPNASMFSCTHRRAICWSSKPWFPKSYEDNHFLGFLPPRWADSNVFIWTLFVCLSVCSKHTCNFWIGWHRNFGYSERSLTYLGQFGVSRSLAQGTSVQNCYFDDQTPFSLV